MGKIIDFEKWKKEHNKGKREYPPPQEVLEALKGGGESYEDYIEIVPFDNLYPNKATFIVFISGKEIGKKALVHFTLDYKLDNSLDYNNIPFEFYKLMLTCSGYCDAEILDELLYNSDCYSFEIDMDGNTTEAKCNKYTEEQIIEKMSECYGWNKDDVIKDLNDWRSSEQ